jgi:hypothetical protein
MRVTDYILSMAVQGSRNQTHDRCLLMTFRHGLRVSEACRLNPVSQTCEHLSVRASIRHWSWYRSSSPRRGGNENQRPHKTRAVFERYNIGTRRILPKRRDGSGATRRKSENDATTGTHSVGTHISLDDM